MPSLLVIRVWYIISNHQSLKYSHCTSVYSLSTLVLFCCSYLFWHHHGTSGSMEEPFRPQYRHRNHQKLVPQWKITSVLCATPLCPDCSHLLPSCRAACQPQRQQTVKTTSTRLSHRHVLSPTRHQGGKGPYPPYTG